MNGTSELLKQFNEDLLKISNLIDFENIETKYLGRNGVVNKLLQNIKDIPAEQRKQYGQDMNKIKSQIEQLLNEKRGELKKNKPALVNIDTTLPGIKPRLGNLHPTTIVVRKINSFFRYLGYSVYEGPEIESNEFNFEKLNLPKDHPARELMDTLYIKEPEYLLRTHTSSVEARALTQETLPLRIVVPGKVYRNETSNPTNNSVFYQYEGLYVDRNVTLADLKGTLIAFVKFLYGPETKTRFRCKYYPQVEPGAGLDVECTFCHGNGCPVCKYRGYIEALGAGMVHPNMLRACGIDPKQWSGFAFGVGLDRLVMLQYEISDIRKLYSGELVYEENL